MRPGVSSFRGTDLIDQVGLVGKFRHLALIGFPLLLAGCDLLTGSDKVPRRIEVSPAVVAFDAIGEQNSLSVQVFDRRDDQLQGVTLSWSTSNPLVAEVSPSGVVTARGNGSASVFVSAGDITEQVPVTVSQLPYMFELVSGGSQIGVVDQTLPVEIRVRLLDRLGTPIQNSTVLFNVSAGGGSVNSPAVSTDGTGTAAVLWKLGTIAGATQTLAFTAAGGNPSDSISATARPGPPAGIIAESGHLQSGVVGTLLPNDLVARVIDGYGNPVPDIAVTFTVTQGGGMVNPSVSITNSQGRASTRWTLGTVAGTQGVNATIAGVPPTSFGATALPGPPAQFRMISGDGQAAAVGTPLPAPLIVRVLDSFENGVPGVQVVFTPGPGMGSANPSTALTQTNGNASTVWTLGPTIGNQTLTASVPGFGFAPLHFSAMAVAQGGGGTGFDIEFNFVTPVSSAIRQVFEDAAARWAEIIVAKLPDITFTIDAGTCGNVTSFTRTFDDLYVLVEIVPRDGVGGILGSAGPCYIRLPSLLPFVAQMQLDLDDVNAMLSDGTLFDVILHELGHTLGIGTSIWGFKGLLANPSLPASPGADTHFTGDAAIAAYNSVGGSGYTGGAKVPVENTLGSFGTRDSHWRTAAFGHNELMTGFISSISPLSRVTAASLADLGYTVNLNAADPYVLPPGGATAPSAEDGGLRLMHDVFFGPIRGVGPNGEVVELLDTGEIVPVP